MVDTTGVTGWIEVWRLNDKDEPEKVRVLPTNGEFVLVEGEQHTSYKGNFFNNARDAYRASIEDAERSIRYGNEKKERIERGWQRFQDRKG